MFGGAGSYLLIGGTGADHFIYTNRSDSTASVWDCSQGFEKGADKIAFDLSYGVHWMTFAGSEQSFFRQPGEIWIVEAQGNSYVRVDTDGDLGHGMQIVVEGVTGLTQSDLIF